MSSHSELFGIRVLVYAMAIAAIVEAPRVAPSPAALRVIAERDGSPGSCSTGWWTPGSADARDIAGRIVRADVQAKPRPKR